MIPPLNPALPYTGFPPPQLPPPPPPPSSYAIPPPLFLYSTIPSAPFPPPISTSSASDLPTALSSLASLLQLSQNTLNSLSSLLPIPSPTTSPPLARCPFNSNHLIPPPSLFSHHLSCSSSSTPLDPEPFLSSRQYPHTLHLTPSTQQLENPDSSELCFSLEKFLNSPDNFYSDCPGAVINSSYNHPLFSHPVLTLPRILSAECANYRHTDGGMDEMGSSVDSMKLLPSEIWAVRLEINGWNEYPSSYSCRVLRLFSCLKMTSFSQLHEWILVNSPIVVIDSPLTDHIVLLFKLSLKAIATESINLAQFFILDPDSSYDMKFECPSLVETMRWFGCQLSILYGEVNGKSFAIDMLKHCVLDSACNSSVFPIVEKILDSPIKHDGQAGKSGEDESKTDEVVTDNRIYVSQVASAVAALHERSWLELKIKALRYPQPLSAYQRKVEYENISRQANDERRQRSDYRPVIEHDGFLWQRSNNQDPNRIKTKEELLAEERDYKRRRLSYRGKKMKRSTTQVMRDIIDEYMDEMKKVHGLLEADDEGVARASERYSSHDGHLGTGSLHKSKPSDILNRGEQHNYEEKVHYHRNQPVDLNTREYNMQRGGDSQKLAGNVENERSAKRTRSDKDYPRSPYRISDSHSQSHTRSEWKRNDRGVSRETVSRSSDRSHSRSNRQKNHQKKENESHLEIRNRRNTKGHPDLKSHKEFEDRYNPSEFNSVGDDNA